MQYALIKKMMSNYYCSNTSNFINSFGLFCCRQNPFTNDLKRLLANKNLNHEISATDLACLANTLAKKVSDSREYMTKTDPQYTTLLTNLTENIFSYDVIDLCIKEKNKGVTIDVTTLNNIRQQAETARYAYSSTYENLEKNFDQMNYMEEKYQTKINNIEKKIAELKLKFLSSLHQQFADAIHTASHAEKTIGTKTYKSEPDQNAREQARQLAAQLARQLRQKEIEFFQQATIQEEINTLKNHENTLNSIQNIISKEFHETREKLQPIKQKFDRLPKPEDINQKSDYFTHYQSLREMCTQMNCNLDELEKSNQAKNTGINFNHLKVNLEELDQAIINLEPKPQIEQFDMEMK